VRVLELKSGTAASGQTSPEPASHPHRCPGRPFVTSPNRGPVAQLDRATDSFPRPSPAEPHSAALPFEHLKAGRIGGQGRATLAACASTGDPDRDAPRAQSRDRRRLRDRGTADSLSLHPVPPREQACSAVMSRSTTRTIHKASFHASPGRVSTTGRPGSSETARQGRDGTPPLAATLDPDNLDQAAGSSDLRGPARARLLGDGRAA
jgi:hypothetical protein